MICINRLCDSLEREINKNGGKDAELEEFFIELSTLFAAILDRQEKHRERLSDDEKQSD